jgi:L-threonylcarbamoyladenylate synthase
VLSGHGRIARVATVYDCSRRDEREAGIAAAAGTIRSSRLVVFPTDTVYGIGCDAFDSLAVNSLLDAKGRGRNMPLSVLVGSWSTVDGLVLSVPKQARDLVEAFWPGGLSIVLPHAPSLAWDLGETRGTVMVRMPLHPVALELLREIGPMAQSSANISGQQPATTVAEARSQLGESVAVYLDGGPAGEAVPSSIVDLTGETPRMLREGAVTRADVSEVLGVTLA